MQPYDIKRVTENHANKYTSEFRQAIEHAAKYLDSQEQSELDFASSCLTAAAIQVRALLESSYRHFHFEKYEEIYGFPNPKQNIRTEDFYYKSYDEEVEFQNKYNNLLSKREYSDVSDALKAVQPFELPEINYVTETSNYGKHHALDFMEFEELQKLEFDENGVAKINSKDGLITVNVEIPKESFNGTLKPVEGGRFSLPLPRIKIENHSSTPFKFQHGPLNECSIGLRAFENHTNSQDIYLAFAWEIDINISGRVQTLKCEPMSNAVFARDIYAFHKNGLHAPYVKDILGIDYNPFQCLAKSFWRVKTLSDAILSACEESWK